MENYTRRETGLAGKLVIQGNDFCRKICFMVELVLQGLQRNWFCKEVGFAGKLVSEGNWFILNRTKVFVAIIVINKLYKCKSH